MNRVVIRTLLLVASGLLVAQCQFGADTSLPGGSSLPTIASLPADVQALGQVRTASADEATRAISQAEAVSVASPDSEGWPAPDAYLVVLTVDGSLGTENPILDRLIWLVRWEGLEIGGPAPSGADEPLPYSRVYTFIDGATGEYLMRLYKV